MCIVCICTDPDSGGGGGASSVVAGDGSAGGEGAGMSSVIIGVIAGVGGAVGGVVLFTQFLQKKQQKKLCAQKTLNLLNQPEIVNRNQVLRNRSHQPREQRKNWWRIWIWSWYVDPRAFGSRLPKEVQDWF